MISLWLPAPAAKSVLERQLLVWGVWVGNVPPKHPLVGMGFWAVAGDSCSTQRDWSGASGHCHNSLLGTEEIDSTCVKALSGAVTEGQYSFVWALEPNIILNWKRADLNRRLGGNFWQWEWWDTGTGCPGKLCMPPPWRCSGMGWTGPWAAWFSKRWGGGRGGCWNQIIFRVSSNPGYFMIIFMYSRLVASHILGERDCFWLVRNPARQNIGCARLQEAALDFNSLSLEFAA